MLILNNIGQWTYTFSLCDIGAFSSLTSDAYFTYMHKNLTRKMKFLTALEHLAGQIMTRFGAFGPHPPEDGWRGLAAYDGQI